MSVTARKVDNTILIWQDENEFIDIISGKMYSLEIPKLSAMLLFLVKRGLLDKKVLQGILSEVEE